MPFVDNHGIKIHYEVEGQGPPLMLMHGFTRSLEDWRNSGFVPEMKDDYQLILVDVRGHGQSDKPDNLDAYSPKIMAEDVVTIMDELNIEKAHYLGYSMGARIGFYGVARYFLPRLDSLILGGFTACPDKENLQENQEMTNLIQSAIKNGMQVIVSAFEKQPGIEFDKNYTMSLNPQALFNILKNLSEAYYPGNDDEIASKIQVPCLFYLGELEDSARITGVKRTVDKIPGAKFISLPQLNHWGAGLQSSPVVPHIKEFLREVENSQHT